MGSVKNGLRGAVNFGKGGAKCPADACHSRIECIRFHLCKISQLKDYCPSGLLTMEPEHRHCTVCIQIIITFMSDSPDSIEIDSVEL